ncbi:cryptococcal mannosyltransferase 1-domain-containing protein [Clohesyomyces aquaticus]|uniref:Cryptococcal mannosyltransferase 1-domain-containing protein n=1 Tax=Clohesyomyces aquaticus TaxID=1231657 RepID=A0A1Y2A221_9PLEO|nr:cryptococcal mannosyltransferase 1-domain-containing protein [Clohesyomyces aquaticus]
MNMRRPATRLHRQTTAENPDNLWDTEPGQRHDKSRRTMLFRLRLILRRYRRIWLRILIVYAAFVLTWDTLGLVRAPSTQRVASSSYRPDRSERFFIASIHWNNEVILRSHWNHAVLDLVRYLGPEHTYVAVLESGSWDNSKGALRELEEDLTSLNAPHAIVLEDTTHQDELSRVPPIGEEGWVWTPRNQKELRRIPYLAKLRNRVMDMMDLANDTDARPFTKVLWVNDVVFTVDDVRTLLSTNGGDYAAACSLDFSKPPLYYDTFALRDISGEKPVMQTWPYFLSSKSRSALISSQPVPVESCWNGIVALDAAPFLALRPPRFRGIPDTLAALHLEGSECCLIHIDNPLSTTKGVWLNPLVRVGYNPDAYDIVKASANNPWPSFHARLTGLWYNRWARWTGAPRRVLERLTVRSRLKQWKALSPADESRVELGQHCLINEMQVLVHNGWKHV